jgi:hypothetical protein
MSRIGTEGAGNAVLLPASGFAAQIIGQVLGRDEPDLRDVTHAYERAQDAAFADFAIYSIKA